MTFDGMLTLLSILVLLVELTGQVSVSGALSIYEDGAVVSVFPRDVFSEADCNLTFQVSIDNVVNLYGLDVQLSWNPTVIQYLGHHKMIPVEAHPGGVPYSPTIPVENDVDDTASMAGAELEHDIGWLKLQCFLRLCSWDMARSSLSLSGR